MTSAVSWMGASGGGSSSGTGGGELSPSFQLQLLDAGAGIVNTTPDFSTGSPTPTFTRASTAYTLLSNGLYGLVATGQPRSYYSAAGIYQGYLSEGARADLLGTTDAIRRTMSDVGWVVGATMTKGTATGVDGTAGIAASMTGGAVSATNIVKFTTVLGAAVRTFSAWVRRKTGTGTVNITVDSGVTWTPIVLTASYQQFQVTSASVANQICGFQIITNGDAIEIDFCTLEAATFANPTPIPVNVSKAADVLTFPKAGNVSSIAGSLYMEIVFLQINPMGVGFFGDDNSGLQYRAGTGNIEVYDGAFRGGLSLTPSLSVKKAGMTWGGATSQIFLNGAASTVLGFDGDMGFPTNVRIGTPDTTAASLFGPIKNIKCYPTALSAAAMQAMTT